MNEALKILMKALGLQTNCAQDSLAANVLKIAEQLKANGKLTGKQFESLAAMDEEQRGMVGAILGAMGEADKAAAKAAKAKQKAKENADDEGDEEEEEDYAKNSRQPTTMSQKDLDALVDKRVAEAVDRREREGLISTITANSANTFEEDELKGMSVNALRKYELSIRPVDYSGQGGFAAHQSGEQTKNAPLLINTGLLAARKDAAKAN